MHIVSLPRTQQDEALQLVRDVFMEFEAPDYSEEGTIEVMRSLNDESYLSQHQFFGAYVGDTLAGVIATRNEHHHIGLLFVKRQFQRQNIGRQLIQHILTLKDDAPITVNASPYGHEFYHKMGFRDTNTEQIYKGVRFFPMVMDERVSRLELRQVL